MLVTQLALKEFVRIYVYSLCILLGLLFGIRYRIQCIAEMVHTFFYVR